MRRARRIAVALTLPLVLTLGCSATLSNGGDGGGPGDGGLSDGNGGGNDLTANGCTSSADCMGDVCVSGQCCATASVCGSGCCGASQVCLFDQCVTPGKACHTANDCPMGQYCETSLGQHSDGGAPMDDAGASCTQPIPLEGRCLAEPPRCLGDGGTGGADGGCVPNCEYHPVAGGPLSAVARWSWGPANATRAGYTDVWSTPTVARIYDANCDGKVDELDPPDVVFVAGKAIDATTGKGTCCQCNGTTPTACHTGILRMLDGRSGAEIWSLDKPNANSAGWAGLSTAVGDIDGDHFVDVVAVDGEGYVHLIDRTGTVVRSSDQPIPNATSTSFGWGGGLAVADMDGDGYPEIAFGRTVFGTKNNTIKLLWSGSAGMGGAIDTALSTFADLDGDGKLELLAGNTAYKADSTTLWNMSATLPDGLSGVGDFNRDGKPEAVLVKGGKLWVLNGADGTTLLGPATLPGTGDGGPPTVADFDGDGKPEIGVAMATFYSVMKPNFTTKAIDVLWSTPNHDLSSSVTGSTVFDFEGDGKAEVIYADECFLWVFDGTTGKVRFAAPHTSFTATEASLLADVDGDGRAEMVMVSNSADPTQWKCLDSTGAPTTVNGYTWVAEKNGLNGAYRGITVFGDSADSWVGTRTLWNEHTYHVSNICDDRDTACSGANLYGTIPQHEAANWTVSWLDDFRQNVQDKGLFDAPDATVSLAVDCVDPVVAHATVRNLGLASLPAGVTVGIFRHTATGDVQLATAMTTHPLQPGQAEVLTVTIPANMATHNDQFDAQIIIDMKNPQFHECRTDNDTSDVVTAVCLG